MADTHCNFKTPPLVFIVTLVTEVVSKIASEPLLLIVIEYVPAFKPESLIIYSLPIKSVVLNEFAADGNVRVTAPVAVYNTDIILASPIV